MATLHDKRILITGAASGIGLCTARELAREGSELVLTDIAGAALEAAAESIRVDGGTVHTYVVDVSDQAAVEAMAARVLAEVGSIDVLINNAGIGYQGELAETSLSTWRKLLDVNFWGPLYHVYAFLPHMRERGAGHIVNVSSGQAYFRLPTWGAYAAIKGALGAFSEILHFELAKYGIAVTTVYPFMVNTPFYRGIEGETWAGRLSMKLVPYYSMTPERVGRIIAKAVKRRQRLERVSVLNHIGQLLQVVPKASALVARVSSRLLVKRASLPAQTAT